MKFSIALRSKIKNVLPDFRRVDVSSRDVLISFSGRKADLFRVERKYLSNEEVLEITGLIADVYEQYSDSTNPFNRYADGVVSLNSGTIDSTKMLKAILELNTGSLHKLLLMTSAEFFLNDENFDLIYSMVVGKKETNLSEKDLNKNRLENYLKYFYILPGFLPITECSIRSVILISSLSRDEFEAVLRILSFVSQISSKLTLREYLEKSFSQVVDYAEAINDLWPLEDLRRLHQSRYKELSESLCSVEYVELSRVLNNDALKCSFPEDFLRRRAAAGALKSKHYGSSVMEHLSQKELATTSIPKNSESRSVLEARLDVWSITPSIVYSAFADVLAQKGYDRTLEIVNELDFLKDIDHWHVSVSRVEVYEATVVLILSALLPEADGYLFSWLAQTSEQSWLFSLPRDGIG